MSMFDTRVAVIILAIGMDSTPRDMASLPGPRTAVIIGVSPDLGRHLDTLFALASRHRIHPNRLEASP